ncbi:hypothetical protein DINM_007067 [Dirofilaria immitis]|nr:hypothetical protein [Dirofilaria immitis]
MKLTNNVVALFTLIWFCSYVIANNGLIHIPSDPYDLNAPCQPYIEKFAEASSKMIKCATVYSSPPKVCTYCTEEYIALKHIEYKLLNLMNDTMNLWHNVWHCPDDRVEELRDWTLLGYSLVLLMIITAFFYAGSYIQSSEIQRHLVQYSQLAMPSGIRSHLLSSSLDRVSSMSSTSGTEQITTLE